MRFVICNAPFFSALVRFNRVINFRLLGNCAATAGSYISNEWFFFFFLLNFHFFINDGTLRIICRIFVDFSDQFNKRYNSVSTLLYVAIPFFFSHPKASLNVTEKKKVERKKRRNDDYYKFAEKKKIRFLLLLLLLLPFSELSIWFIVFFHADLSVARWCTLYPHDETRPQHMNGRLHMIWM